jgi:hypothetical protein
LLLKKENIPRPPQTPFLPKKIRCGEIFLFVNYERKECVPTVVPPTAPQRKNRWRANVFVRIMKKKN